MAFGSAPPDSAWGDAQSLPWLRVKGKGKFALPPVPSGVLAPTEVVGQTASAGSTLQRGAPPARRVDDPVSGAGQTGRIEREVDRAAEDLAVARLGHQRSRPARNRWAWASPSGGALAGFWRFTRAGIAGWCFQRWPLRGGLTSRAARRRAQLTSSWPRAHAAGPAAADALERHGLLAGKPKRSVTTRRSVLGQILDHAGQVRACPEHGGEPSPGTLDGSARGVSRIRLAVGPAGASSETGCWRARSGCSISATRQPSAAASSSVVGAPPRLLRSARAASSRPDRQKS